MELQKQKVFTLDNKVIISSKFESGNISKVVEKTQNHYNLWIGTDHNSTYKTWFYFSIEGVEIGATVTFTINNMNNQVKLFKQDHLPVFRQQQNKMWQRIKLPIQQNGFVKGEDGFQLTFKHHFTKKSKHYFAFSYPWTTKDCDNFINNLIQNHKQELFAHYDNLAFSSCKRAVKLLTLTKLQKGTQWKQIQIFEQNQNSLKPMIFQGKKGIFISARVHPGQVASSHILNGILNQLFSSQETSTVLLQKFVFYIVPIINPDGVDEGNFRTDTKGKNLNRCYTDPNQFEEPEIYAIKKFLVQMINENYIEFCLDLHAHINKQGAFIYGNSIEDLKGQVEVCLFPKILAFNCPFFDYDGCNFSEKNMSSKDKADELSKQGASRVAIFKQTGLKACWTLECNYNSCKYINELRNRDAQIMKSVSNGLLAQSFLPTRKEQKVFLGIKEFHKIGSAICESILDYYALSPAARYFSGKIKSRQNFTINLGVETLRMIPFRFDNNCRKILTAINSNMNLTQNLNKIKQILTNLHIGAKPKFVQRQIKKYQQSKSKEAPKVSIRKLPSEGQNRNKPLQNNQKSFSLANQKNSLPKADIKPIETKNSAKPTTVGKTVFPVGQIMIGDKAKYNQINGAKIPPKPVVSINRKV